MQAAENRTVAFSLSRSIIKNATAQFFRLLQFFKGTSERTAASVFGCPQNGREGMGLYPKSAARQESSGGKTRTRQA